MSNRAVRVHTLAGWCTWTLCSYSYSYFIRQPHNRRAWLQWERTTER